MKKELYNSHYEMVIDKDWNDIRKNKADLKSKNKIVVSLCIIEFVILFLSFCMNNERHFGVFFAAVYASIISTNVICKYLTNVLHYKKMFPSQFVWFLSCIITCFILWAAMFNFIPCNHNSIIAGVVVFVIILFVGNSILTIKNFKARKKCSYKISALCIDNKSEIVNRYAVNNVHSRIERKKSVAYSDDETITVYTPVFQFVWNGIEYKVSPSFSKNEPYDIGKEYQIYINPNNPNEIKI